MGSVGSRLDASSRRRGGAAPTNQCTPPDTVPDVPLSLRIVLSGGDEIANCAVNASTTVLEVKREIEIQSGLRASLQELCAPDTMDVLVNEATLSGLNIISDTVLTVIAKTALPPNEIFGNLDSLACARNTFTWDTTLSTDELDYSRDGLSVMCRGRVDCSLVLGSRPMESGVWFFEVKIQRADDETWVGVTNDRNVVRLQRKTTDTMTHSSVCAYYDGQRSHRCPPIKNKGKTVRGLSARQYSSGSVVGVLADIEQRCLCFYLNGELQAVVHGIPEGQLWPVAHMDTRRDIYILQRRMQLPEGCVLVAPSESDSGPGDQ